MATASIRISLSNTGGDPEILVLDHHINMIE